MNRPRIAVIFHRFGPYHVARLRAVADRLPLLAIEESAESAEYAWDVVSGKEAFKRVTLLSQGERPSGSVAWEIARRLRAVLDRHRPAAVVVPGWSDPAALAALDWSCAKGVPAILMSESTAADEPRRGWKEAIKSRIVRLAAAGLAGGTPHAEYLTALGLPAERIYTGYDAVDNLHFSTGADAARARAGAEREVRGVPGRYFLAVSRFVEQKNLFTILEAFADFSRQDHGGGGEWHLVLLGDGPLRDALTARCEALSIGLKVHFLGFKQYAELPAYFGLADAFIHASQREPWGLVVNEAMAAGLPVLVSARCGCARDLVAEGENGFLFDPADTTALVGGLTRLAAATPAARTAMGEAGRQRIATWSPENFARQLERAVDLAQSGPPPRAGVVDRGLLRLLITAANAAAARLLPAPTKDTARV